MNLLAVNYHYIGDESEYRAGIYPVSVERFRRQLETLGKFFAFVGEQDIIQALDGKKTLPENSCIITFDDGLRGQYSRAWPILQELKIPATVYVSGLPHAEGKVLLTHKIHWCRAHLSPEKFLNKAVTVYEALSGKEFNMEDVGATDEEIRRQYLYDSIPEARLKYLLNKSALLDANLRESIVNTIFSELVSDEREFCASFYITPEGVKELYQKSSLGIHGYSHKPLALLSKADVLREIQNDFKTLAAIVGEEKPVIRSLSYPYGSPELVSSAVADSAASFGLRVGFTMERAFNTSLDQPLLFARLDANDIPAGKTPLFTFEHGILEITDKRLSDRRKVFLKE